MERIIIPEEAKSYIRLAEIIAGLENSALDGKRLNTLVRIGSTVRNYDAAFDEAHVDQARVNADLLEGALRGENVDELGMGMRDTITEVRSNLGPRALSTLIRLNEAQRESIEQRGELERSRIIDITRKKGGITLEFFAELVSSEITEKRRSCYQELGYLIQLLDDLADEEIDRESGILTLATVESSNSLALIILRQYEKVIKVFQESYEQIKLEKVLEHIQSLMRQAGFMVF